MSYALRQPIRASRTLAIAIVALSQATLGYALVTSLAYSMAPKAPDGLKIFSVQQEQPPPPPPRHTPKRVPERQPRVEAPPPIVRVDAGPSAELQTVPQTPLQEVTPAALPALPPPQIVASPPPIATVPPRSASGDLQRLFRPEDYPITALEHKEQGSVTVRLTIGMAGRVGACDVTSSSGSPTLDNASCHILQTRALFSPARDSSGNLTSDTVFQEIRWRLG